MSTPCQVCCYCQTLLSDVKTLREKARQHISEGAITPAYKGDVKQTIDILQTVLATESHPKE